MKSAISSFTTLCLLICPSAYAQGVQVPIGVRIIQCGTQEQARRTCEDARPESPESYCCLVLDEKPNTYGEVKIINTRQQTVVEALKTEVVE